MIRLLTFSTLYPNVVTPTHGIFVETRLRHLIDSKEVVSTVVAPVPWFPWKHPGFGKYSSFAAVPRYEERSGISVHHPRYILLPKVGMTSAPYMLARGVMPVVSKLISEGKIFDAIDAHYFYPDGVAAVLLGRALGKPVVITARGSDVNVLSRYTLPRQMMLRAARQCAAVVTVCSALKRRLIELGADGTKITVLRNGVDLEEFYPEDRIAARSSFAISGFALLSVGRLVEMKGHDLVIAALTKLPSAMLLIAGSGPAAGKLRALAREQGVSERVHFLGDIPQERLRTLYSAADILVLASSMEGWPNVLLEAMACGTPVIASAVGGIPEVITASVAGILLSERTPDAISYAAETLRRNPPCRAAVRRYAESFSWDVTTRGQVTLFSSLQTAPVGLIPSNA